MPAIDDFVRALAAFSSRQTLSVLDQADGSAVFAESGMRIGDSHGIRWPDYRLSLKVPLGTEWTRHYKFFSNDSFHLSTAGTVDSPWSESQFLLLISIQSNQLALDRTVTDASFVRLTL